MKEEGESGTTLIAKKVKKKKKKKKDERNGMKFIAQGDSK